MENEEKSLAVSNNSVLTTNLFGEETVRVKKATNINIDDEEQADMLLNAMQDTENKINDFVNKKINCIGYFVQEFLTDTFNEETGEQVTRKKHTLTLFDEKGVAYVTGSNSCYMSFCDIISIKGEPTTEHVLTLIPIKVDAKEKGHSYLKLRLAKKGE